MRESASKSLKVVFLSSFIGLIDGLQAKYFTLGSFGNEIGILYQTCFLAAAGAAAYFALHNKTWSTKRNMVNLMMSIPVAMIGDNVSIDAQKLRPYFMLIPKEGFVWREDVFGHTFLSPVAYWVNQQTLTNGLIDGYLASIGVAGCYVVLQYFWSRHHNRVGRMTKYQEMAKQLAKGTRLPTSLALLQVHHDHGGAEQVLRDPPRW